MTGGDKKGENKTLQLKKQWQTVYDFIMCLEVNILHILEHPDVCQL